MWLWISHAAGTVVAAIVCAALFAAYVTIFWDWRVRNPGRGFFDGGGGGS